jgi:DNA-binding response OmpR family regulator
MRAGDLTYRDRALSAEALAARLEAELAEYRRQEIVGRRESAALSAHRQLVDRIRPHLPSGGAPWVVARLFDYLLAHAGELRSKDAVLGGIATKDLDDYETLKLVEVAVCHGRKVLRAIGLGDALVTAWGRGYELRADRAEALRAWCEGRA